MVSGQGWPCFLNEHGVWGAGRAAGEEQKAWFRLGDGTKPGVVEKGQPWCISEHLVVKGHRGYLRNRAFFAHPLGHLGKGPQRNFRGRR